MFTMIAIEGVVLLHIGVKYSNVWENVNTNSDPDSDLKREVALHKHEYKQLPYA